MSAASLLAAAELDSSAGGGRVPFLSGWRPPTRSFLSVTRVRGYGKTGRGFELHATAAPPDSGCDL